jgi:hypothetical protein
MKLAFFPVALSSLLVLAFSPNSFAQNSTKPTSIAAQVPDVREMRAKLPLEQKIAILQHLVETVYYGEKLIPASMLYDGGVMGKPRDWIEADLVGQSLPKFKTKDASVPPIKGLEWLLNENSSYLSGGYLLSQVYRYETTRDKKALAECSRALKGLQVIADLAGPDRFGWICKPFGGRYQDHSSPDQSIYIVQGLWSFLPYAKPEEAAWIRKFLPAMADYWKKVDYVIFSFQSSWDTKVDKTFMRMFDVINQVAYKISKNEKYKQEAERIRKEFGVLTVNSVNLFDTRFERYNGYKEWTKVAEYSINVFAAIQLNILMEFNPSNKKEYLDIYKRQLEQSLIGYDKEYGGHYYYTEVKFIEGQYYWRPMKTEWPKMTHEELVSQQNMAFTLYPHRTYWLDATSRVPMLYLMYLKYGGEKIPYIESVVRDIMDRLDFEKLHWMTDPHHDQTVPESEYVLRALTSEIQNYISAYYLGKQMNFWK